MPEQLGSGLQNRVDGCNSRSGLNSSCPGGGIGIRTGLKILSPQGIEGSSPSPGTKIIIF